jgi:hypothetical protein
MSRPANGALTPMCFCPALLVAAIFQPKWVPWVALNKAFCTG